jgi:hypothetical protein
VPGYDRYGARTPARPEIGPDPDFRCEAHCRWR